MAGDDGTWFDEKGGVSWGDIHRHEPMADGLMAIREEILIQKEKAGLLEKLAMALEIRGV
jgi:hypothetical protein